MEELLYGTFEKLYMERDYDTTLLKYYKII